MTSKTKLAHLPRARRAKIASRGGASPSLGFSMQGRNVPAVIKGLEASVDVLKPHNKAQYVELQREFWGNDYPYRECGFFSLEDMARCDNKPLKITDLSGICLGNNALHNQTRFVFRAHYKNWGISISELAPDFHTDLSITVFNGTRHVFHALEARNQILAHHSEEVYQAWKQKVNAEYQEAIAVLIAAAKKELGTLTAWSATCSPSSERLMRSTPGITVKGGIAYLIF